MTNGRSRGMEIGWREATAAPIVVVRDSLFPVPYSLQSKAPR
jgi:hypothetical protein